MKVNVQSKHAGYFQGQSTAMKRYIHLNSIAKVLCLENNI